ncbi:MAG: DUF401 family protein [Clostridia bacterium]|nr:DUF401 family protein [Clostridia bacterium]
MEAIKDIIVLALLVYMFKKRILIGHIFMSCAILFGLLHALTPFKLVELVYITITTPSNVSIYIALYLITFLERIMRKTGAQAKLVEGLVKVSGNPRVSMAALPAIIGLLPSPGGARFSAPLVERAAQNIGATPEDNAAINYYYRHLWEYFLPLYPATLVAAEVLRVPLAKFILLMLPYTAITILAGITLFRKVNPLPQEEETVGKTDALKAWKALLEGLTPIVAITLLVLLSGMNIALALTLVLVIMLIYYRIAPKDIGVMLIDALELRLLYMLMSALFMREVLVATGSTVQLLAWCQSLGLSPLLITIIFPMLMGLLTGVTLAGVTMAMPVVVTLAGPDNLLALGTLAFASIVIGIMLSPTHLCLIMSIEHFSADFGKSWVKLVLPYLLIMAFALAYYYILSVV